MEGTPFKALMRSRKFWIAMMDMVISLITYFVGKYAQFAIEDVALVIGSLQPVVLILIGSIAWEDAAAKRGGNSPRNL